MANVLINENTMVSIGNSIRNKLGTSTFYLPSEMPTQIDNIPTGSTVNIQSKTITENGTYTAPTGTAYSPVIVNVPSTELIALSITENGTYTAPSGKGYATVTAAIPQTQLNPITIVTNGTYTPTTGTGYGTVTVNVPSGSNIEVESKTITENGTYTAPSGKAYSPVVVNVPTIEIESLSVTSNGTYTAPSGKSYGTVTVNVPSGGMALITGSNVGYALTNDMYENTTYTQDLTSGASLFMNNTGTTSYQNYDVNFTHDTTIGISLGSMFYQNSSRTALPPLHFNNNSITDVTNMFGYCYNLATIPDDYVSNVTYNVRTADSIFRYCYKLKRLPQWFYDMMEQNTYGYGVTLTYGFQYGYNLQTIDLVFPSNTIMSGNKFGNYTFGGCSSLRRLTISCPGTDSKNWQNQNIYLTGNIGYFASTTNATTAGMDASKRITDATTYQALKDDPGAWTTLSAYSFFNHDSALALIQSLPSTMYSNTLTMTGSLGSSTDAGAVNTLTAAEKQIATDKGWSIYLQ